MKEMVFPIVFERKPLLGKILLYTLISSWAMTIILQIEKNPFKEVTFVIAMVVSIGVFVVGDLSARAMKRKVPVYNSNLRVMHSGIQIQIEDNVQDYIFSELNSVTLEINETGFDPDPKGLVNQRRNGIENWVEIRTVDGEYYKYRIYVDSADEIERLDFFLEQVNEKKIVVKRSGEKVTSIKKAHYNDFPTHYKETRRSKI